VEHTALAREVLGHDPLLAPEQAVLLEPEPDVARPLARKHMATYLALSNYAKNLRRLGWSDEDLADGGSDRLVDALVAWGDVEAVLERVRSHHDRGADHVAIRVLSDDPKRLPLQELKEIATAFAGA